MRAAIRLGSIFGIAIYVHFTWFLIFALVTFSLVAQFAAQFPALPHAAQLGIGILASLLFFSSVLFHELAHSWLALRQGYAVRSITLFVFGGVSEIEQEAKKPASEIQIAMIGPLSSYLLALVFGAIWYAGQTYSAVVSSVAGWLALINVGLGTFNLLPGLPLDGGRVLRGVLWKWTGSLERATRMAASAGRFLGYLFILQGIFLAFGSKDLISGLWLVFIGWFLNNAAEASQAQMLVHRILAGLRASQVMTTECSFVPGGISIAEFVESYLLRYGQHCFVVGEAENPRGIITFSDVRALPRAEWANTSVQATMRPLNQLWAVAPDSEVEAVLELMAQKNIAQVPVLQEGKLLGMIARDRLLQLIQTRIELHSIQMK